MRRTRVLDVAGGLAIISSGYVLFNSFLNLGNITSSVGTPWTYNYDPLFAYLVIMNTFVFPFGLTAGIFALLRKKFTLTTIGISIQLFSHVLSTILPIIKYPYYFLSFNLGWGTPIIIASTLSLIFIVANKEAFG